MIFSCPFAAILRCGGFQIISAPFAPSKPSKPEKPAAATQRHRLRIPHVSTDTKDRRSFGRNPYPLGIHFLRYLASHGMGHDEIRSRNILKCLMNSHDARRHKTFASTCHAGGRGFKSILARKQTNLEMTSTGRPATHAPANGMPKTMATTVTPQNAKGLLRTGSSQHRTALGGWHSPCAWPKLARPQQSRLRAWLSETSLVCVRLQLYFTTRSFFSSRTP